VAHNITNYKRYYTAFLGKFTKSWDVSERMSPMSFSETLERHGESIQQMYTRQRFLAFAFNSWHRCDERFIGYGGNKAACLVELYSSGIDFIFLSDDFIIHQSHTYPAQARRQKVYIQYLFHPFFVQSAGLTWISGNIIAKHTSNIVKTHVCGL
jgi:Glycosyl-transferase for dystroglycan